MTWWKHHDTFYSGSGSDVLHGNREKDTFVFDTKLGTSETGREINFDTIKDLSSADDALGLNNKVLTKLGKGMLSKTVQL